MKFAAAFMDYMEYGNVMSAYNLALEENPELLDAYIGISGVYEAEKMAKALYRAGAGALCHSRRLKQPDLSPSRTFIPA